MNELDHASSFFEFLLRDYKCFDPDDDVGKFKSKIISKDELKVFLLARLQECALLVKDECFDPDLNSTLYNFLNESLMNKMLNAKSF